MNVSRVVVMNRDEEDAIMEAVAQSTMEEDQKHIEEVMKEESEKKEEEKKEGEVKEESEVKKPKEGATLSASA